MKNDDLQMKKYSANYVLASSNFVVQNLRGGVADKDLLPCLNVVRNILQRGCPTMMSRYLQEQVKGVYDLNKDRDFLLLIGKNPKGWQYTIKGSNNGYNPAKMFYEEIVPREFGEAVQAMIIPEYGINDIVGEANEEFLGQQVDFYLPQALLVIEIDGGQHEEERMLDMKRVNYLNGKGVKTVRITTNELANGRYRNEIEEIRRRLHEERFVNELKAFCDDYAHFQNGGILSEWDLLKFQLTATIRFELLVLDLLERGYLKMGEEWYLNIRCDEPIGKCVAWAIRDVMRWLRQVILLRDKKTIEPRRVHGMCVNSEKFRYDENYVNIDFSVLKRYTDENRCEENIVFVRGDYFEYAVNDFEVGDKHNNFRVSTSAPINYHITEDDKPTLEFFLQNIFSKEHFRDGQVAIIANALNLEDTVGLLPTGGGKSLCYQLPCLLQPCINFVVCPIKSLMDDQVENLNVGDCRIGNVAMISSDDGAEQRERLLSAYGEGKYLFVLISPERFQVKSFRFQVKHIVNDYSIAYAVIDEVHCMSEWGHDFRTSYLNLTKTIDNLSPKDSHGNGTIKFIGLTATASLSVLKDIRVEFARGEQQLEDTNIKSLLDYSREELEFEVIKDGGEKLDMLLRVFDRNNIPYEGDKATLVFTPTVNGKTGCYPLYEELDDRFPGWVGVYSGSVPKRFPIEYDYDAYKKKVQRDFKSDKLRILCATKAFGMGIDKNNIYYTVHYGLPASIESLYQEAGRAGRWEKTEENKDKKAKCYVLYTEVGGRNKSKVDTILSPNEDVGTMKQLLSQMYGTEDIETQLFLFLFNLEDRDTEYNNILNLVSQYYVADKWVDIPKQEKTEKYVYRLMLLGLVKDWMVDFKARKLSVYFCRQTKEGVYESLEQYIWKYDSLENVRWMVDMQLKNGVLKNALWYLLGWIHNNILESRKQSLRNVKELCESYESSSDFKARLDDYFVFTESTFVLQAISEHPLSYNLWFSVFYDDNENLISMEEFGKMKMRLSRFLESFHNNVGLNFVSGMVRLKLDEFDNADGRDRLGSALDYIKNSVDYDDENAIIDGMIDLMVDMQLSSDSLLNWCMTVIEYYPEKMKKFGKQLGLPIFENEEVENSINKLKTLKSELYERLGKI